MRLPSEIIDKIGLRLPRALLMTSSRLAHCDEQTGRQRIEAPVVIGIRAGSIVSWQLEAFCPDFRVEIEKNPIFSKESC
jgi:hypothetical protein